jgi:hypothetical protein
VSDNFKDGDYLGQDHILSADYGFGCAGGNRSPHFNTLAKPALMGHYGEGRTASHAAGIRPVGGQGAAAPSESVHPRSRPP